MESRMEIAGNDFWHALVTVAFLGSRCASEIHHSSILGKMPAVTLNLLKPR